MAKSKKPKPKLLTLEEQLAEHDRERPEPGADGYGQTLRREWTRRRVELVDAIRHRNAKLVVDDTVEVAVDDPEDRKKRRKNLTRCRQSEAFRHNRLTPMQQEASREMALAWQSRTIGLGPSRSKFGSSGGGRPDGYVMDEDWKRWCADAVGRRIMTAVVIDCLAEPMTLTDIERKHRMRRGQAMTEFCKGLDLWCELRGWMRGPRMQAGPHLLPEGMQ